MPIKTRKLPDLDLLRDYFEYEPDQGILIRKVPPLKYFTSEAKRKAYATRFGGTSPYTLRSDGYLKVAIQGKGYQVHRLIWKMCKGVDPKGEIDHIDGNKLNNCIDNLRDVNSAEQSRNACLARNNTTGHIGVRKHRKKWQANGTFKGINYYLGSYSTYQQAVDARVTWQKSKDFSSRHGKPL